MTKRIQRCHPLDPFEKKGPPSVSTVQSPPSQEDPRYLSKQLITYIGNKRALLSQIESVLVRVKKRLARQKLRCFDVFSGSGVVSRLLKAHASFLACNDLEEYAAVIGRCFLQNREDVDLVGLTEFVDTLNASVSDSSLPLGFIEELYAPRDEVQITKEDRVFYTRENARRIDVFRQMIEQAEPAWKELLLGPLLSKASIHANTAGIFKGFYKNKRTKIGQFGGTGQNALGRICKTIHLETPVLSRFPCDVQVLQEDAISAVCQVPNLDLAYLDPPYNQHPYGSNYFMLNLIARYQRPQKISKISGIPADWKRSNFNVKARASHLFAQLLDKIDASFLLISFNNEGFISPQEMVDILQQRGKVEAIEIPYNAFRGSRNFDNRSIHVTEHLFLVERF